MLPFLAESPRGNFLVESGPARRDGDKVLGKGRVRFAAKDHVEAIAKLIPGRCLVQIQRRLVRIKRLDFG